MAEERDGRNVVDTEGVKLGTVELTEEGGYWVKGGPMARFFLSSAYVSDGGGEEVRLSDTVQALFSGLDVMDRDGTLVGTVREVLSGDTLLDLFIVESSEKGEDDDEEGEAPMLFVPPEWMERIEDELHLERTLEDVMFHQEDHTFRKEVAHYMDEHD